MKKITLLLIVCCLVIISFSFKDFSRKPRTNSADMLASEQRSERIVLTFCAACHGGDDGKLSGKLMEDLPKIIGVIYTPNITKDDSAGIGKYSRDELRKLLRTGIKRNGKQAFPLMPRFPLMADADVEGIIDFLKSEHFSVQPAMVKQPPLIIKFIGRMFAKSFKPMEMPKNMIPLPDSSDQLAEGKYLVTAVYRCWECHTKSLKQNEFNPDAVKKYLGGGFKMGLPGQQAFAANISPDKETGIGNWTLDEFTHLMRTGIRKNGKHTRYPMPSMTLLTQNEITSIYKYLMTVTPVSNKVKQL